MRFASIASGSSGNCAYVGSDRHHLLIDDGLAGKRVSGALHSLGVKPEELDAVLITHGHRDHVSGLGVFSRRYHIPLYATEGTIGEIRANESLGEIPEELFHPIADRQMFDIGDLRIHSFPVSHDAAEPVAYRVCCEGKSLAVVTDLGRADEDLIGELRGLDAVLLEANHDVRILEAGPYPYELKCRILSGRGHLCNEDAGRLLNRILHDGMKRIFLGHLSRQNNYPDLAAEAVKLEIDSGEGPYRASDFPIETADRDRMSPCVTL